MYMYIKKKFLKKANGKFIIKTDIPPFWGEMNSCNV